MSAIDRLWLSGFTTAGEMLQGDRLAIEEVRQVLEGDPVLDPAWLMPWTAGLEAGIHACFGC